MERYAKIAFLIVGIGTCILIAGCTKETADAVAPAIWGITAGSLMGL